MRTPNKASLSASTTLFAGSIVLYCLLYKNLSFGPTYRQSTGTASSDLGIKLHPEDHVYRRPRTIYHYWNVTKGYASPDGVEALVYKINGGFPGPTVEARSGDTLVIEVQNQLPGQEGLAFHWHGLNMRGANRMDGVVGITQDPIQSGGNFSYEFVIDKDQAGTFWYHSHSELQRGDGLYGGLVVHKPSSNGKSEMQRYLYDEERLLLLGDWYHRPAEIVQASYVTHKNWGLEPVPDSLLINGWGNFNCSMAVPSRPVRCVDLLPPPLMIEDRIYRYRVVNAGAMSGITISIPGALMRVIQVDGGNDVTATPEVQAVGVLYPGERTDTIVWRDANSQHGDLQLNITLDPENFVLQNKALTPNHFFRISRSSSVVPKTSRIDSLHPSPVGVNASYFNLSKASGLQLGDGFLNAYANQTVLIYTKIEILAKFENIPMGFINRTSWAPQATPTRPLIDLPRSSWDSNQLVPWIHGRNNKEAQWIDIVINNLDEKGHPFHLHGNPFYLLSTYRAPSWGYHTYNPLSPSTPGPTSPDLPGGAYNLRTPLLKDTVYVPRMGYVVLRIRADNPGIWFLHCHILWHQGAGMAMALQIGDENREQGS